MTIQLPPDVEAIVKAKVATQLQHGLLGRPSKPAGSPEGTQDEPPVPDEAKDSES